MKLNEARSGVARLNARLLEINLAVAVNPAIAFSAGDRTRLSWPQAKDAIGLFTDAMYASLSEYRAFLSGGHYTCVLNDGSLIQVSYDFKNDELVGHRFCFYPCPLDLPKSSYATDFDAWNGLLETELYNEIEALESTSETGQEVPPVRRSSLLRLRSPIRFDFDPDKQSATEPSSHVHISDAEARIPVHAALSLAQFVHFVITHFYPVQAAVLAKFPIEHYDRCIQANQESRLHFDCRRES